MKCALILLAAVAGALAGCSNTRGTWSCGADRGVPCQSIADLDGGSARPAEPKPSIQGASMLRWWSPNDATAGAFDGAPRREPDQVIRVLVAGWTDAVGDFHAPSEIYAVMRRGGWWAAPPVMPLASAKAAAVTKPSPSPKATDAEAPTPAAEPRDAKGAP